MRLLAPAVAFVDLETTGLIPGYDRIVEIGAVAFSVAAGVEAEFTELVDPGIPIPPAAARVSGSLLALAIAATRPARSLPGAIVPAVR